MYCCRSQSIGERTMLITKCAGLAAAAFALCSVPVSAQTTTTGSIEGTVTDQTGTATVTCPRGVVVKNNDCLPPGRAKQLFRVGQRVPTSYRFTQLSSIPMPVRRQVPPAYLNGEYKYIYRDGVIYLVESFNSKQRGTAV